MALTGSPTLAQGTDQELLRLTPVNVEAFGVFYDRYEREVLAFFWRRTGRADLAADMTSEVFARALEAAARFDDDRGSARTWLYMFARQLLVDAWRHGRVENAARARLECPIDVLGEPTHQCNWAQGKEFARAYGEDRRGISTLLVTFHSLLRLPVPAFCSFRRCQIGRLRLILLSLPSRSNIRHGFSSSKLFSRASVDFRDEKMFSVILS